MLQFIAAEQNKVHNKAKHAAIWGENDTLRKNSVTTAGHGTGGAPTGWLLTTFNAYCTG